MLWRRRFMAARKESRNNSVRSFRSPYLRMPLRPLRVVLAISPLVALLLGGCNPIAPKAAEAALIPQASTPPRLIVFITVDQLRGDMLDRYRSDLQFGYARLLRGAHFTNAFQDHAITETAPG